jgi:hypothetical protein
LFLAGLAGAVHQKINELLLSGGLRQNDKMRIEPKVRSVLTFLPYLNLDFDYSR